MARIIIKDLIEELKILVEKSKNGEVVSHLTIRKAAESLEFLYNKEIKFREEYETVFRKEIEEHEKRIVELSKPLVALTNVNVNGQVCCGMICSEYDFSDAKQLWRE